MYLGHVRLCWKRRKIDAKMAPKIHCSRKGDTAAPIGYRPLEARLMKARSSQKLATPARKMAKKARPNHQNPTNMDPQIDKKSRWRAKGVLGGLWAPKAANISPSLSPFGYNCLPKSRKNAIKNASKNRCRTNILNSCQKAEKTIPNAAKTITDLLSFS